MASDSFLTPQPSYDVRESDIPKASSVGSGKVPRAGRRKRVSEKTIQKKRTSPKKVTRPEPTFPRVIRFNRNGVRLVDVLGNKACLDDAEDDFGKILRRCHIRIQVRQQSSSSQCCGTYH